MGKGTALRGALDLDIVTFLNADAIATLLRTPGSGFQVYEKLCRSRIVFARYRDIEVHIAPRTADFDYKRGPLGHVYNFGTAPERHNNLVRLLKGWARTHAKVPGILLEVAAKEAQSPNTAKEASKNHSPEA